MGCNKGYMYNQIRDSREENLLSWREFHTGKSVDTKLGALVVVICQESF